MLHAAPVGTLGLDETLGSMPRAESFEGQTALLPDLVGDVFFAVGGRGVSTFRPGDPVDVYLQIENVGLGTSPPNQLYAFVYLSPNAFISTADYFLAFQLFAPALSPGWSTGAYSIQVTLPNNSHPIWYGSGTYYLGMVIDPLNWIAESNELNNSNVGHLKDMDWILAAAHPSQADLTGAGFKVETPSPAAGGPVDISFGVFNWGLQPSNAPTDIAFYLSRDSVINSFDYYLGWVQEPALASFSRVADRRTFTIPPPTDPFWQGDGTYYLGMIVDPWNTVPESNESNNSNYIRDWDWTSVEITVPKPDLIGLLEIDTASPLAGGEVQIGYTVANVGYKSVNSPLDVTFYLSRDATIDAADRAIGTTQVPALGGSSRFSGEATLTLPDRRDSIWNGTGTYYIGMVVDSTNAIAESDETNNSNRQLGEDTVSTTIALQYALSDLPATGFPVGALASEYLKWSKKCVDLAVADLKELGAVAKGAVSLTDITKSLNGISSSLGSLRKYVDWIRNGSRSRVSLGSGLALDRTEVELLDRFALHLFKNAVGHESVTVASVSSPVDLRTATVPRQTNSLSRAFSKRTAGENDDDWEDLEKVLRKVWTDFDPKKVYDDAAAIFNQTAEVAVAAGQGQVARLAAQASAVCTAIGRIARFARAKIAEGNEVQLDETIATVNETLGGALWDEILQFAKDHLGQVSKEGDKLLRIYNYLYILERRLGAELQNIRSRFDDVFNALRSRLFRGTWQGDISSPLTLSDGRVIDVGRSGRLSFSTMRDGVIPGTVQFTFLVTDQYGNVLRTGTTKAKFQGRFTLPNKFEGTIELRTPAGLKQSFPFSWDYDGDSLSGAMYADSLTTFRFRKR